ncbi:hypothetical protein NEOLEDRAFT_1152040 [Neolentinus lepideus HHB14362 ss-1]|uniref:Uncharacterized protein n=1 Tax=Neolentinus lepideus HHB14362 ss-1 TaxID=1314782 RepID=A0A165N8F8_9AGAM|nr:hypothetical protein NEOLEDRAFT_1152040 [Neolentinus lepideus HHB14362 ss-1]
MPCVIPIPEGYVEVSDNRSKLKCIACSEAYRKEVLLNKKGIPDHEGWPKHINALKSTGREVPERLTQQATTPATAGSHLQTSALLCRASFLEDLDSDDDNHDPPQTMTSGTNPFDDMILKDDEYFLPSGERVLFSAGAGDEQSTARHTQLEEQMHSLDSCEQHTLFGRTELSLDHLEDDSSIPDIVRAMRMMGLEEDEDEEVGGYNPEQIQHEGWEPYESKTMFMIDLLDNLPCLQLLDDHMKAILWVMEECGTPDVPLLTAL